MSVAIDDRKMWRLSASEMERRWSLVRAHLIEHEIDALIVQSYEDKSGGYARWFTDVPAGYPRTVIFHRADLMTVLDHGPQQGRKWLNGEDVNNPGVGDIITNWSLQGAHFTQTLAATDVVAEIRRRGYRRVATAGALSQPFGFISTLLNGLKGAASVVDETDFLDRAKAIKSAEEIARIEETARVQDEVFELLLGHVRPGMRDFEINAFADYQSQLRGSERGTYIASSAPLGAPAAHTYRHFQARTMSDGDHTSILIENNGYGGYWTEISRTIVFGKASPELREGFEICRAVQAESAKDYVPGAACADIFARFNALMAGHGCPPETRLHSHSQGHDMVERPIIRSDETMIVEPGMNFAIHPTLRNERIFAHICDNYLVDVDGTGRFIHQTPKQIFEL